MDLVEAQETRRILDRLYGYEVSPVLWRKVMSGLSAGRVQSVATRLVVDRERERMRFRVASYWDLEGTFDAGEKHDQRMFPAKLHSVDETRVARGGDFGPDGELKDATKVVHLTKTRAEALSDALRDTDFVVRSVESKPYTRRPYAPFRTTTLQQESSRKLGFGASRTMSIAQRLYENGHITYMRTDSTTLSETAVAAARAQARDLYGPEYLPDAPRVYASKVKNAQEAHEAIRPAGDSFRTPAHTGLTGDEFRLYELIWMRTIASQMKDAVGQSVTIRLGGAASTGEDVVFSASGRVITFHGFLKAYVEGRDDAESTADDQETRLPNVAEGDEVSAAAIRAEGHQTKPPARYTEATLIKELEEREIGRPSTYASILGTILNRGYVYKKGNALVPAWLAFSVIRLLEEHFTRLVSYEFTARMEDVLDEIAGGRRDRNAELAEFYFGSGEVEGLKKLVSELGDIDAKELATFPVGGADSGIALRVGKYGPYLEGPGDDGAPAAKRANVPEDLPPDELTLEMAKELLTNPAGEEIPLGEHPETGLKVVAKNGRYGPFVTELLPEDAPKKAKPRTGSLFKDMSLETIDLEQAVRLLSLPRVVGVDDDGVEITAQNGRYGPYLKRGTDSQVAGDREPALRHHPRASAGDLCPAQAAWSRRGCRTAQGARQRPGLRGAGGGQGGAVRGVRHRRGVQRHPAQGGLRRGDHHRAGSGAPRRAPRQGASEEGGQAWRQEDHQEERQEDCEEDDQEDGREEVLTAPSVVEERASRNHASIRCGFETPRLAARLLNHRRDRRQPRPIG